MTACYSWLPKSILERVHMAHSVDTDQTPGVCEPVQQSSIPCTHRDGYV